MMIRPPRLNLLESPAVQNEKRAAGVAARVVGAATTSFESRQLFVAPSEAGVAAFTLSSLPARALIGVNVSND
jgi:hypothetical protein